MKIEIIKRMDCTKISDLKNDNIMPKENTENTVYQLYEGSNIPSLTLPKSEEVTESEIQAKNNASHLFIVDGQECFSLTDAIPKKQCLTTILVDGYEYSDEEWLKSMHRMLDARIEHRNLMVTINNINPR